MTVGDPCGNQKGWPLELVEKAGEWPLFLAVQRGLALVLPLIMVGALALMVRDFPLGGLQRMLDAALGPTWRVICANLIAGSFGIASLAVLSAFSGTLVSLHNQRHKGQFVAPIMAAVVVLSCFFVVAAPADAASWKLIFSIDQGLLIALLVAAAGSALFLRLAQLPSFQLPLRVVGNDPVVRDVLTVMPAAMATIVAFGLLRAALAAAGLDNVHEVVRRVLAAPFVGAGDDLVFSVGYVGLSQVLWFFGAHGPNLLFGIEEHILVPHAVANTAALASGAAAPYIVTKPFIDAFTRMGGSGCTLCLILAILLNSRDGGTRKLCAFALLPALCNVNEPLLFGIPLVLNPIYLVPFLLTPMAQTVVAYAATALEWVPRTVSGGAWTTPALLSGFVATGSVSGIALQVVNLGLGVAIYLPFVRLADRLREQRGRRVMDALLRTAESCEVESGGRKCLDRPGEIGRLAKALASDLEEALAQGGQLFLEYQPQVDAAGNRVHGVEALLRWKHPSYGRIPPPVAVALAEDTGSIDRLGLFVLSEACGERAKWKGRVPDNLVMSVNISPRQLLAADFDRSVLSTLAGHELPASLLELEITESLVIEPDVRMVDMLHRLRDAGVRVAIDDFGMGHASLRYLREFPVDTVKIDRSLTMESQGRVHEHIVRSIVDLSHTLGFTTVVEGVEMPDQLARFRELGCTTFQGYLFSRPVAAEDCVDFICAHSPGAAGKTKAPSAS